MLDFGLVGRRSSVWVVALTLLLPGYDEAREAPPRPDPDKAIECRPEAPSSEDAGPIEDGGARPAACAAGQICLQGRCYASCTDDSDCGPREECGASGACVRGSGPMLDAGPPDSGPPSPCDGVECAAPSVCHPLAGVCVECSIETVAAAPGEPGFCAGLRPICDVANGACVEFAPRHCAPCRVDAECDDGTGAFVGRCTDRTVMGEISERVCLLECDPGAPACPPGLVCDAGSMRCIPPAGASCTTWLRGNARTSCLLDTDCAPIGADRSLFTGACIGEDFPMAPDGSMDADAGPPTPGACFQPCGVSDECPNVAGGQMCSGEGAMLFCQP